MLTDIKRVSLIRYWISRYLLALFIGLVAVGGISAQWIRQGTARKQMALMSLLADEIADRMEDQGERGRGMFLGQLLDSRSRFISKESRLNLIIYDSSGRVILAHPRMLPPDVYDSAQRALRSKKGEMVLGARGRRGDMGTDKYYVVKRTFSGNGGVVILQPVHGLRMEPEDIQFLAIMLSSVAVIGLAVIYIFLRQLSRPIGEVAAAAKRLMDHDYNVKLRTDVKEQEVYDLVSSFQEMATRLDHLETMRTELLAGVTHELKTPVASIRGLIGAVQDGVVDGDEAQEFLRMSISETKRLQKMVEDLLDYNSLTLGAIQVNPVRSDIGALVREIVHQWELTQGDALELHTELPDESVYARVDPIRLQQVMVNLLNNAKQAAGTGICGIRVLLSAGAGELGIRVLDEGPGIPGDEQALVFERFFRGRDKKHAVRGLGLGLAFSRMAVRAMDGELSLEGSRPGETTFLVTFPVMD